MADRPVKAKGMNWVNPYLVVKDMKGTLDFYEKVFGFKTSMTMPDPDGNLMHAEMQYQDCVIMIGAEDKTVKSPSTLQGSPVGLYLYVDDVDGLYEKVKGTGAEIKGELKTQFWGDRTFNVTCPEGHNWTFAQNVADFDPENVPK